MKLIYTLVTTYENELSTVSTFTSPREAYKFIHKHIKPLTDEELRSLDKGRGKPVGSVLYKYDGLLLRITLIKGELITHIEQELFDI